MVAVLGHFAGVLVVLVDGCSNRFITGKRNLSYACAAFRSIQVANAFKNRKYAILQQSPSYQ